MKTASSSCPVQASIVIGDVELTQLQVYSCLIHKTQGGTRNQKQPRKRKK